MTDDKPQTVMSDLASTPAVVLRFLGLLFVVGILIVVALFFVSRPPIPGSGPNIPVITTSNCVSAIPRYYREDLFTYGGPFRYWFLNQKSLLGIDYTAAEEQFHTAYFMVSNAVECYHKATQWSDLSMRNSPTEFAVIYNLYAKRNGLPEVEM